DAARADGFDPEDVDAASIADVMCLLVPDDVIPTLPLAPRADALVIVASGYTLAFGRLDPPGDSGMVAPRMLGPEVRRCYEEGVGFITAVGVHHDATGRALDRVLAVAKAIGGLRQGALALTPMQEAVLDLGVEQVLSPALTAVNTAFVQTMIEHDIPLEAIVVELVLSGEVERTYRLLREVGYAVQSEFHSPTSQYGQLTRRGRYDHLDFVTTMRALADDIEAVEIPGPTPLHAEHVIAAARAGKHVSVQKPIANTVADGRRMVQAASDAGVIFRVTEQACYYPPLRTARDLIASGVIGAPTVVRIKTVVGRTESEFQA